MIDPTAALTAVVPPVANNPLDNAPSPGIARFGNAPAAGQAQSAPKDPAADSADPRVPGANAGVVVAARHQPDPASQQGWWAAAGLFLLSAAVGLIVIRRFANVS
jgi:hypothetical protein